MFNASAMILHSCFDVEISKPLPQILHYIFLFVLIQTAKVPG
jgi:hypothetical protein